MNNIFKTKGKKDMCIQELTSKYKPRNDFECNTHISIKNNYIYFQISKSASSTVKVFLQQHEFEGSPWCTENVNNKKLSPHLSPFQLKETDFLNLLTAEHMRNFTFVRNPYSRLLSCYLHRIVRQPNSKSGITLKKLANVSNPSTVPFDEFVRIICDQDSRDMESHWRVQYDEIMFPEVKWSFIGKFENLNHDIETIIEILYGAQTRKINGGTSKVNASPMSTSASSRLRQYYNDKLMALIADRYELDFQTFNYDMELPS